MRYPRAREKRITRNQKVFFFIEDHRMISSSRHAPSVSAIGKFLPSVLLTIVFISTVVFIVFTLMNIDPVDHDPENSCIHLQKGVFGALESLFMRLASCH